MPFDPAVPRSWTSSAICQYAPLRPGVYGISNAAEWIYIGASNNIQEALLRHLKEGGTSIIGRQPSGFVFETCGHDRVSERLDRLILEYNPTCNGKRPSGH